MSALASSTQDRTLDLNDILRELMAQGRVSQEQAEQCLMLRRGTNAKLHPLEFLAAQQVDSCSTLVKSSTWKA